MGGAGFTAWSGVPTFFEDVAPNVTFEGDNTVMAQQAFNYLLKMAGKVIKGKTNEVLPIFKYLELMKNVDKMKCKATKMEDFLDIDQIVEAISV